MQARRWVAGVCAEIGRPELRENAELALSEVVTNAILHGSPPVTVRLRGTRNHPRVEVRDGSADPPAFPPLEVGQEFLDELPTFGRGLGIVASSSEAWGAERDGDGKLVWFVPASSPARHPGARRLPRLGRRRRRAVVRRRGGDRSSACSTCRPTCCRAPSPTAPSYAASCGCSPSPTSDTYPVASDLSHFFSALARDFRGQLGGEALLEALQTGRSRLDLDVKAPIDAEQRFARLLELLDLADAFCRNERLLTLARTPEQVVFQRWLFGEFVRQAAGDEPEPWPDDDQAPDRPALSRSRARAGGRRRSRSGGRSRARP